MEPMLDVSNLSFDYLSASSCLPVIDNISFQAFEGDFISIVGPSGCGKSTLLDIIAGLMPSSAGQVFFLGEPVIKPRKEIGYMLQRDQLFEWRSILRNTLLGPEIQHSSHKDKCLLAMILAAFWVQSLLNYPAACARELLLFAH